MPTFIPDNSQKDIIYIKGGNHLVLAPPGCGKTQILTERIRIAHDEYGVHYDDMLCLTFTNRAARGMADRISSNIDDAGVGDVYVGNVHRYCIRMLASEGIVPANAAIIDDDDAISIMARIMNVDEVSLASNWNMRRECFDAIHLSQLMHQILSAVPRNLRLHPECLTSEEVRIMKAICLLHRVEFTPQMMGDFYHNAQRYIDSINGMQVSDPIIAQVGRANIIHLLTKMNMAHEYEAYKKARMLVDFNDILLLAYDALTKATACNDVALTGKWQKHWVQVDEVQDLNPLQMAIIDLLIAPAEEGRENTVIYLGDEQQAIFSFMGAKLSTLEMLRKICGENIHFLANNHRSPHYLLDIFNTYAEKVLGISPSVLPNSTNKMENNGCTMIHSSSTLDTEYHDVALMAERFLHDSPDETTAIVVASNADADFISEELNLLSIPHFKISGTDLFSTPEVKLLLAHFTAMTSDTNTIAWARIMMGTKAMQTAFGARDFVHQLVRNAIAPCELLSMNEDDASTYTQRFARAYEEKELVIFDTETTGLDTFHDDIIQIAAMKVRGKEILGSFMVHIETEREIPVMLGDIVNPIIAERQNSEILSHSEALHRFAEFIGDATLLAHNADFDIHILESNVRRYSPDLYDGGETLPECFDSLRLVRLLEPELRVYKLKYLLEVLHLEGNNSHLADDDVFATKSLVDHCYAKAKEMEPHQKLFLTTDLALRMISKLQKSYAPLYHHTKSLMWKAETGVHIADELTYIHEALVNDAIINKVEKLPYICDFLRHDLIDSVACPVLAQQLMKYVAEMNTLKEADLCDSKRISERIYVSTVHKAKGLEFDNVIVFDAVDGRYPSFNAKTEAEKQEDARKLYVALSRSKRRLVITISQQFVTRDRNIYPRSVSPFLIPVLDKFN